MTHPYKRIIFYFSVLLVACNVYSCKKSSPGIPATVIHTGSQLRINDLIMNEDGSGVFVGGARGQVGITGLRLHHDTEWQINTLSQAESAYCIERGPDSTLWIGGGYLSLYQSEDFGESWDFRWIQDVPFHEEDRSAIRDICFLPNDEMVMVGGENYGEGIYYHSIDLGEHWSFTSTDNEMRGVVQKGNRVLACGYGRIEERVDSSRFRDLSVYGQHFSDMAWLENDVLIAVSVNGGIYKSVDDGYNWNKVIVKGLERLSFKKVGAYDTKVYAIGSEGLVAISSDYGDFWEVNRVEGHPHFFGLSLTENYVYCSSDNGQIYRMNRP